MYHSQVSPRTLTTIPGDPISNYPARWELMLWYRCWRKYPYPTEAIAAIAVEGKSEDYAHYPCPIDPSHWHHGRGGGGRTSKQQHIQAKRVYRKAIRDEIRRAYDVVHQQEERERGRAAAALAD
jgi:hypothetical protein